MSWHLFLFVLDTLLFLDKHNFSYEYILSYLNTIFNIFRYLKIAPAMIHNISLPKNLRYVNIFLSIRKYMKKAIKIEKTLEFFRFLC